MIMYTFASKSRDVTARVWFPERRSARRSATSCGSGWARWRSATRARPRCPSDGGPSNRQCDPFIFTIIRLYSTTFPLTPSPTPPMTVRPARAERAAAESEPSPSRARPSPPEPEPSLRRVEPPRPGPSPLPGRTVVVLPVFCIRSRRTLGYFRIF